MSDSFARTQAIERESRRILKPVLLELFGNFHFYADNSSIEFQVRRGDARGNDKATGARLAIEHKAERENKYGNLFIETWSHKRIRREGWIWTSRADRLAYHFIDSGELFVLDMPRLQVFAASTDFLSFPEKLQKKYSQENDTWGRCVRIHVIRDKVGFLHEANLRAPTHPPPAMIVPPREEQPTLF